LGLSSLVVSIMKRNLFNMKRIILSTAIIFCSLSLFAQIPEDAIKYSWQPTNGTARIAAVGGAMGSLGGDISATFVNPAGLGFYKTSDFVLSPGLSFLKNKSDFRGTKGSDKDKWFNLGTSGIVSGWGDAGQWTSKAISLAVTRSANFSNRIYYTGKNDFSSFAEQYAADAAKSGHDIGNLFTFSDVSLGTRMANVLYVIDTATLPGHTSPDVISTAMYNQLKKGGAFLLDQSHLIETSGGITEIALGFAFNRKDKFYVGGSFGIPIVKYNKHSVLTERDATGSTNNYFNFVTLDDNFTTTGAGINAKLGIIAKPVEYLRLGFAIHTPTWYSLTDSYEGVMSADLENFRSTPAVYTSDSKEFTNGAPSKYKYELVTPWKFLVSGSYVLREIEDVTKQKGFITADIEYATYPSNRFKNAEDYDDNGLYDAVNSAVKDYYKGAFNFRLGGEVKFTTLMARLGFSYYGDPYKDKELKGNKMYLSGGLGYRHAGMYIDLTYVHSLQKDVDFPYRLSDKANTFATLKPSGGNIMLTLGFKI
jgi:hypothetical protein